MSTSEEWLVMMCLVNRPLFINMDGPQNQKCRVKNTNLRMLCMQMLNVPENFSYVPRDVY